jgi:hypothetical protein
MAVTINGTTGISSSGDIVATGSANIDVGGDGTIGADFLATSYQEKQVALSGTSPTVDCALGNIFTLTTSGTTAFGAVSNVPTTGTAYSFTLIITAGGAHTVTYDGLGTNVYFSNGFAPPSPLNGETDVLVFMTFDGGTTWYGSVAINAAAQI